MSSTDVPHHDRPDHLHRHRPDHPERKPRHVRHRSPRPSLAARDRTRSGRGAARSRQSRPPGPDEPDACDEPEEADEPTRTPVARCADGHGTLTALFFSDNVHDIARAKAMCGLCPVKEQCLADALAREEPWGVWGGELLSGGRIIANKRPCGRPPKHPRPELVYDEMGPVGVVA